jgi:3-hydroxyisobutyrate dehydrogenase-like beta-hydroxyacid dehydrogenase
MAFNLFKKGWDLTVYARKNDVLEEFAAQGVSTTTELTEAGQGDVVCLCLPNGKVVEEIFYRENGLMPVLKAGQTVIDFSTISYSSTIGLAQNLAAIGVRFLDAPISGMEARAADGTLTVMCGGEKQVFDEMLPLMQSIGTKILYMGAGGSGQLTKLINQLLFDINAAALAEILPMSVKMGLDPQKVGEVVNSGTGRSWASEYFIPRDLEGVFEEGYPLEAAYKDLISATELGIRQGIPLPVLSAATATYQAALLKGYGKLGKGAMLRVFEELLDVEFRAKEGR